MVCLADVSLEEGAEGCKPEEGTRTGSLYQRRECEHGRQEQAGCIIASSSWTKAKPTHLSYHCGAGYWVWKGHLCLRFVTQCRRKCRHKWGRTVESHLVDDSPTLPREVVTWAESWSVCPRSCLAENKRQKQRECLAGMWKNMAYCLSNNFSWAGHLWMPASLNLAGLSCKVSTFLVCTTPWIMDFHKVSIHCERRISFYLF